jgi:hypothetical protein
LSCRAAFALTTDSARVRAVARRKVRPCRFEAARPAYALKCPAGLAPNPVATIVTSYLHTPAKRSTDVYLQRMETFFKLQASIVAYIDFAYVETAERMARSSSSGGVSGGSSSPDGTTATTVIVPVTYSQFRTLACGLNVWRKEHRIDVEHDIHVPTLYPVWAEKATMVAEAARANCFGSALFVWLDVGYFSETPLPAGPFPSAAGARAVEPGKTLLLDVDTPWLQRIADAQFDANRTLLSGIGHHDPVVTLGGGGFAGDAVAAVAWERAYLRMLDRYRARGWYAGKDQNLFASVCIEAPGLCTLHDSKLQWYDLVHLLAGSMRVNRWEPASVGGGADGRRGDELTGTSLFNGSWDVIFSA